MSEPHTDHADHAHDAHAHEGHISDKTFIKVFVGLLIFTAISFLANQLLGAKFAVVSFLIIGTVAVCKAFLVVVFFMHLKIDWRKVFMFLVPICILAPMMIIVLWPDIVLAWRLAKGE
jgi:caa(3)-type oxidase subunit IV